MTQIILALVTDATNMVGSVLIIGAAMLLALGVWDWVRARLIDWWDRSHQHHHKPYVDHRRRL